MKHRLDIRFATVVCSLMDVCYDLLWLTNKEEYVDARAVICEIMSENGMTDKEIARTFGKTRQCINKLRNNFRYRQRKWSVRNAYDIAKKENIAVKEQVYLT